MRCLLIGQNGEGPSERLLRSSCWGAPTLTHGGLYPAPHRGGAQKAGCTDVRLALGEGTSVDGARPWPLPLPGMRP